MGRKRLPWFRMYAEFIHDPKLYELTHEQQLIFVKMMCLKCEGGLPGATVEYMARLFRFSKQKLSKTLSLLCNDKHNMLIKTSSGYDITNWKKRQRRSDHWTLRNQDNEIPRWKNGGKTVEKPWNHGVEGEGEVDKESIKESTAENHPTAHPEELTVIDNVNRGLGIPEGQFIVSPVEDVAALKQARQLLRRVAPDWNYVEVLPAIAKWVHKHDYWGERVKSFPRLVQMMKPKGQGNVTSKILQDYRESQLAQKPSEGPRRATWALNGEPL